MDSLFIFSIYFHKTDRYNLELYDQCGSFHHLRVKVMIFLKKIA